MGWHYFITNNWWYDIKLASAVTLNPNLSIKENMKYSTLRKFVLSLQPNKVKTVGFFWGMSGQIFIREKWNEYSEKNSFVGTQTIHLFVLLNIFKESPFMLIAKPMIKTRADNIRWDTFGMGNALKREKITLDAFEYIAKKYSISYSKIGLYLTFFLSYCQNIGIFYIKKYIFKDQKKILKIKSFLSKIYH